MKKNRKEQAQQAGFWLKEAHRAVDWADNNPSEDTVRKIVTAYCQLKSEYPEFFESLPNDNHIIYIMERLKGDNE